MISRSYCRGIAKRLVLIIGLLALTTPVAPAADKTTAVWIDGHRSTVSDEELLRHAIVSPAASYPAEAQKRNLTGSGLYELQIDKSGKTTQVRVVRSAGNSVLDQAARSAFLQWRFKPASFSRVTIPVSWAVNRVR
ncbi:MAG TPA: energy transducer TonB [Chthoniobacterales bacterium]|nr:energy transducer TonB [Chthoniobacterales bacterium]